MEEGCSSRENSANAVQNRPRDAHSRYPRRKAKQLFATRCNSRFKTHKPRRVRSRRVYESLSRGCCCKLSTRKTPAPRVSFGDNAAVNKVARLPRASLLRNPQSRWASSFPSSSRSSLFVLPSFMPAQTLTTTPLAQRFIREFGCVFVSLTNDKLSSLRSL